MEMIYKKNIIKEAAILANNALYFRDGSKYEKVLFGVLKTLAPELLKKRIGVY